MIDTIWLRGRKWRHGFRVDGKFIEEKYCKPHLFFQSRKEADLFFEHELKKALINDPLSQELIKKASIDSDIKRIKP